jgi:membrane protease YdiL (CAAX protease family)
MDEPSETGMGDDIPPERPFPDGIPVARPVQCSAAFPIHREDILLRRATPGSVWADVGLFVVGMAALQLGAEVVIAWTFAYPLEMLEPESHPGDAEVMRATLLPLLTIRAAGSIAIIGGVLKWRGQSAASVGLESSGLGANLLLGLAATVAVYALTILTMVVLWFIWPDVVAQMEENARRIIALVPNMPALAFGGVAMMVGVHEELIFRGFLMTRLRRVTHSWTVAILISTALFTALHAMDQTTAALVAVALLSLVFSFITVWRRSIIPAIVGHALFDWSQFLLLSFQAGEAWT